MDQRDSTSDRRLLLAGLGLAGAAAIARVARAGDLNPPPGPISPTGSSVAELSSKIAFTDQGIAKPRRPLASCPSSATAQFVITEPGSYYLTGNVAQVAGKVCVDIQCDCVDLDGDGFIFDGSGGGGGGGALSCIRASQRRCIELYECAFRQWNGCCVDMSSCQACFVSDCVFDTCVCPPDATGEGACCRLGGKSEICDCDSRDCTGAAMSVGAGSTIEDCTCCGGSGGGFRCASGCCCDNCAVVSHAGQGFTCGDGCTVSDCECRNVTQGLAIAMGSGCVMERCLSHSSLGFFIGDDGDCDDTDAILCTGTALVCGDRCRISGLTCRQVAGAAVRGGRSISADSMDFTSCQDGLACGDHSSITGCCARGITGDSTGTGGVAFACGNDCTVTDCDCRSSVSTSYQCGSGCCVDRCVCSDGGADAFVCGVDSSFTDCEARACARLAFALPGQCSVSRCRAMECVGIDCGPGCVVTECELTACNGSGGGTLGGAISCRGPRCQVDDNTLVDCPIGIYVFGGAEGCCCDGNQISNSSSAGLIVDGNVASCLCTDNACTGSPPGAIAFSFGSTARGPVVDCTGGGDISALPGSSHHCANWIF